MKPKRWRRNYGVIRTDLWLEEDFDNQEKISARLAKAFMEENPNKVYKYLSRFGMYNPNRQAYENFKRLKENDYWEKTEKLFRKYQKKWRGPNIPIYIFPITASSSFFSRRHQNKSGVAFKDKLFLFISPFEDEVELKALFVHEYHHTCRIDIQNKKIEEANLLDSMILEGLAEHAVEEFCGKKYKADWCEYYSKKEILNFWDQFLKQKASTKKMDKIHDDILYGRGRFPKMVGYAAGYVIVSIYKEENEYSLKDSFNLPSERFISSVLTRR